MTIFYLNTHGLNFVQIIDLRIIDSGSEYLNGSGFYIETFMFQSVIL